jgi:hypothetical protein
MARPGQRTLGAATLAGAGLLAFGCGDAGSAHAPAPAQDAGASAPPSAAAAAAPRAAYVRAVQQSAGAEYAVLPLGGLLRAANPAQRFTAELSADGVRVAPQASEPAWVLELATLRFGCVGELREVEPVAPVAPGANTS